MSPTTAAPPGATTPVRRLVNRDLATVHPVATLREVAEELATDEIGIVVVQDGREPLGVVSERDLVSVIATGGQLDGQAGDLMTVDLVTAHEDTPVADVARLMIDAGVRHVLVHEAAHEAAHEAGEDGPSRAPVTGIVSMRDVVGFLLGDAGE